MKKKISLILTTILLTIPIFVKAEVPANTAFDDYNFYKCVIDAYNSSQKTKLDYNHNLTDEELQKITTLTCDGFHKEDSEKINSIKGIEKLPKLTILNLDYNKLNTIDVSMLPQLTELDLSFNNLSTIDVKNNIQLTSLDLSFNNLSTIDVSMLPQLKDLDINYNKLSTIDLSNNTKLTYLNLTANQINEIDLTNNTQLTTLYLHENNLLSLNIQILNNLPINDSLKFLYTQQKFETVPTEQNDKYVINLKELDDKLDPSRVVFENTDKITYDNVNGIFTLSEKVDTLKYNYKILLPDSIKEEKLMDVTLTLKYNEELPIEPEPVEPEPPKEETPIENPKTGVAIPLVSIFGLGVFGVCGYYISKKKAKKIEL